jgi:hypothetical protein
MRSYPTVSNIQYRLSKEEDGTLMRFHHMAFGFRRTTGRVLNGLELRTPQVKSAGRGASPLTIARR